MAKKIIRGIGKVVKSPLVLGGGALGMLGKKKKAAAPESGPVVMPLPDDEATRQARRRSLAKQMGRGGRSSTILSDGGDTLGGGY